jgi:OmpA-OmpF porin, OOP family
MTRIPLLLAVLAVSIIIASTVAEAGVRPGAFTVSVMGDGYSFDGKQHLQTMPVIGVRGGYNFTRMFGVEALFDYIPTTTGTQPGFGDAHVYRYGGDLLLHLFHDNKLVPYLAAGYGGITISQESQATHTTHTQGIFNYGLGLKYFITDDLAVRGDFRHLILWAGEALSNYEYTVGFTYQFGGRKPVPVAAAASPAAQPEPEAIPAAEAAPAPAQEAPLEPVPAAEPTPGHYKYCVTLHIEFDIDKADIRPEFHDEVARVGDFMKRYPTTTAVIEGHTDNVGTAQHNLELSRLRAGSVVDYLVDTFGIDRSRLSAGGYGYSRPVADNSTDEGRQKNRRIEAIIDCVFDVKEAEPPERLCMALRIEFDTGKADIMPRHRDEIARVADYMKRYSTTTAVIEGHTDNVGGADYNMKLSQKRAESVANFLVEKFGIERSRLFAKGYGFTRRIAYNNTAEGRQKNRRINAVIDCVIKR